MFIGIQIATLEKKIEALEAVKKELERSKAEVVDKLGKNMIR
jgi:hypothetical protein